MENSIFTTLHFHTTRGELPYTRLTESLLMVTVTDMKIIIERWKKGSRPLKIHDSQYGQNLVRMLEKYKETDFAMLEDPFEVTAFILPVGMLSEQDRNNRLSVRPENILPYPKNHRTMNTMNKIQIPERS